MIRESLLGACTWVLLALIAGAHAIAGQSSRTLDAAIISEVVESLAGTIEREYFDEAVAKRTAGWLRQQIEKQRYRAPATTQDLAARLTRDLFELTGDKHLALAIPPAPSAAAGGSDQVRRLRGARENYGVQRAEVLAGNVGYLNLTSFYRLDEARDTIGAAMRLLASTDALIIDMRANGGGSPDTLALLASYLFDEAGLRLADIVPRTGPARTYATMTPAVPERNETRPVYVLTSARTFSAGEGLPFILQERKRAAIVGERTAGAANPGRPYPLGHGLEVTVPNGRVRTAVSGGNWEGRGVVPDIQVAAADALRTAHVQALEVLVKSSAPGPWRETLERHLRELSGRAASPESGPGWQPAAKSGAARRWLSAARVRRFDPAKAVYAGGPPE